MKPNNFRTWARKLQEALRTLALQDFGYPLGTNEVREPISPTPRIPQGLVPLYAVSDGISLPDVHVGYFIDSAERVASAAERREPTRIEGCKPLDIHVFGSDGGGGRFALRVDDGSVYYLPVAGAVKDGVFYEDSSVVARRIAETLPDFLWLLEADINAFVHNEQDHTYIVS